MIMYPEIKVDYNLKQGIYTHIYIIIYFSFKLIALNLHHRVVAIRVKVASLTLNRYEKT